MPQNVSVVLRVRHGGLRHLAFKCDDVAAKREQLLALGIKCEPLRRDDFDGKLMTFFFDPDGLPLELHE